MTASASPRTTHFVSEEHLLHSRLSWSGVFAGLLIALITQVILTLIGTAIGLAAWDPSSGKGLSLGAGIWALISMLAALYLGGMTSGWVSAAHTKKSGFLHGTLVWALTTMLTLWMIANGIGAVVGTTFKMVGNVVGATAGIAAQSVSNAASTESPDQGWDLQNIKNELRSILTQTGNPNLDPDVLADSAQRAKDVARSSAASNSDVVDEISGMIQGTASTVNREDVINVIVARTDLTRPEAERAADRIIEMRQTAAAKLDTFKRQAGEKAEHVASVASTTIWYALAGLILSMIAAVVGAMSVSRRDDVVV